MAGKTKIEWTHKVWNPVTGCSKTSPGCKNCYAERFAARLQQMGSLRYRNGFKLTLHYDLLDLPLKWKKPSIIFVNSMSDLFHENIPDDFILTCFKTMNKAHQHIFQVLTKRSERLLNLASYLTFTPNIWIGVSVETANYYYRVYHLQQISASVRFISCEPLLGPLEDLPLESVNWVIVGGESGPGARPLKKEWVLSIRDQCLAKKIPFFFKQWGGTQKGKGGRILDGKTWDEMPLR
ncbi:MAG: DUF5131 family protein [Dictyoglomus turgidum]